MLWEWNYSWILHWPSHFLKCWFVPCNSMATFLSSAEHFYSLHYGAYGHTSKKRGTKNRWNLVFDCNFVVLQDYCKKCTWQIWQINERYYNYHIGLSSAGITFKSTITVYRKVQAIRHWMKNSKFMLSWLVHINLLSSVRVVYFSQGQKKKKMWNDEINGYDKKCFLRVCLVLIIQ